MKPTRHAHLTLSALLLLTAAASGQSLESPGTVDAVTVYRGQALVSRVIEIPAGDGKPGVREIVVLNLPEQVIPASLSADSTGEIEVRSVSYRVRPAAEDARENVRKLEQQIRGVQDQVEAIKAKQRHAEWYLGYLTKLEAFLAGTAVVENNKGVLNAETITKLSEFITAERAKVGEQGLKLTIDLRTLEEQLSLLQRDLATVAARTSRTAREAVVFLNVVKPGAKLRLNYLVDRATWTPSYNLRAASVNSDQLVLEYQASIGQLSGEDWGDVKMTLSTATPALIASGPSLAPLTIALAGPTSATGKEALLGYADAKLDLSNKRRELEQQRNVGGFGGGQAAGNPQQAAALDSSTVLSFAIAERDRADKSLNEVASKSQLLDVLTTEKLERKQVERGTPTAPRIDDNVAVTYSIPSRTTLPSRSDQQLIQIAKVPATASFARIATPVLTTAVFNQAVITNTGDLVLLAGPSASYIAGEFVGRGTVPTIAAGQTFTGGFGTDSSVRCSRELVERTESIQGGNRVVEFTYRLTMENFGKQPAAIRLIDRVPSPKGSDIKLTLVSTGTAEQPLSKDPAYEQGDKKLGILRWDLTVPPSANGTASTTLEYRFRLEFYKQMAITETVK